MIAIQPVVRRRRAARPLFAALLVLLVGAGTPARAAIDGVEGSRFQLVASAAYVSTADGARVYSWGYGFSGGEMQYPGPTLIVTEGSTVTITLTNALPVAAGNTSIVFPGQDVTASGGVAGLLTREAAPGGSVTYTISAARPGTYGYHSGSRPDLQVEMGLTGALIVRPSAPAPGCGNSAYGHAGTCFDREFLFLLTEMDFDIHRAAEAQAGGPGPIDVATSPYSAEYWFLNGRNAPDTMGDPGTGLLPHQPYNCLPRMHPGERLLMRMVGGGRELHPFHHHGNHARILAQDGRLLQSAGALVGPTVFTIRTDPGSTVDAIFEWTGAGLGWDIYGHAAGDAMEPAESAPDHGKPFPVTLPELQTLTFGGFWSGSPFLGDSGSLPPGEGGLNPSSAYTHMWHSHTEREIVNNDVFPGGMMTMVLIEHPREAIDE